MTGDRAGLRRFERRCHAAVSWVSAVLKALPARVHVQKDAGEHLRNQRNQTIAPARENTHPPVSKPPKPPKLDVGGRPSLDQTEVRQRPTRRQVEVLRAYIRAGSTAAAAHDLEIDETIVRQHLSGLYRRTGVANVAQAAYLLGKAETPDPVGADRSGPDDRPEPSGTRFGASHPR
jgi:DNA-binding NarL/FixJ family response regulator